MRENVYTDQSLQQYLQEIAKTKTLKREEERKLAVRAKKGDQEAIRKLIESNLKFVVSIAAKYQNRGLSLSELISEGNLGLIKGIEKFDPDMDYKLISYAVWWIRQRILFALAEKTNLIRIPLGQANNFTKIRNAKERIRTQTGKEATTEELSEKIDLPESSINKLGNSNRYETLSIDTPYGEKGDEFNLNDILTDPGTTDPKTLYYRDRANKKIHDSINKLDKRSARIIRSYFGLDGNDRKNFAQIAEEFGLSRERIRQIQKKALHDILSEVKDDLENDIDAILSGNG